ncbi:glutaredoxin domain-containing protein [Sutcliffiella rhizosphaerae]|uniref:Glutaredoxin-like protein NrdH n=1 Tax=Sutcliffiella rhizosphaerae TaxID=2880967 RepID=A0ABN8A5I4_9BACI|nr:glutaredoxin domain-containing protein [Sutcliffiella rhizosphaerae]CAG9619909.1 Glutaredoxin-like protein NrdH [Sutcliffiella rhizosphaerae]
MNITVYTQPDCPPCQVVKQFLTHHEVSFNEVNIKENLKARNHLVNVLQSYSTPTVTVDEHVVKGFDLALLQKLLGFEE